MAWNQRGNQAKHLQRTIANALAEVMQGGKRTPPLRNNRSTRPQPNPAADNLCRVCNVKGHYARDCHHAGKPCNNCGSNQHVAAVLATAEGEGVIRRQSAEEQGDNGVAAAPSASVSKPLGALIQPPPSSRPSAQEVEAAFRGARPPRPNLNQQTPRAVTRLRTRTQHHRYAAAAAAGAVRRLPTAVMRPSGCWRRRAAAVACGACAWSGRGRQGRR